MVKMHTPDPAMTESWRIFDVADISLMIPRPITTRVKTVAAAHAAQAAMRKRAAVPRGFGAGGAAAGSAGASAIAPLEARRGRGTRTFSPQVWHSTRAPASESRACWGVPQLGQG